MSKLATDIAVDHAPTAERLAALGVPGWPTWTKEVSSPETCYFLEGDVLVTPTGGAPVRVGKGDLVTFPAGMACTWEVRAAVRKHYRFGA
jgi:uncharacterized cupin superfamily protein